MVGWWTTKGNDHQNIPKKAEKLGGKWCVTGEVNRKDTRTRRKQATTWKVRYCV
jgi:hypothetical protein